ncbi:MAG: hypothetical protein ACI3XZ_00380 [Butyricicoccus sp.]
MDEVYIIKKERTENAKNLEKERFHEKKRDFTGFSAREESIRSEKVKNFSCNLAERVYNRTIEGQRKSKSEKFYKGRRRR